MSSTFLTLMQDFCAEWGLPIPTGVVGSTDTTYVNLRALTDRTVKDLIQYPWASLRARVTFVSIAAEVQGTMVAKFGAGYRSLSPGTMWNDTDHTPIFGPVGDISWQVYKSYVSSGPLHQYKVLGESLSIFPALPAGKTISAVITTRHGILDAGVPVERITADDNTVLFPDEVFLASLDWRWKKKKGQAWAAEYELAQGLIRSNLTNQPVVHLDDRWGDHREPPYGVWVGSVP